MPSDASPTTHDGSRLAIVAALVTVVLWASAFVGIRSAGADISAGPLTFARLLTGSAVLWLLVWRQGGLQVPRADLPRVALCGLLWFAAYNVLLNAAEHRIDAGTAAMLVNLAPVFIALLAGTFLGEGFPRSLVLGCVIAFAGALLIGYATTGQGGAAGWGAAMCVLAALACAAAVVIQKPLLERMTALQVTFGACSVGAIACAPFAPSLVTEVRDAETSSIVWAIYLGVFPTAIGFTTWAYALARTSAGKLGATTYLVTPVAVLLGWAMLGETPAALALAGGVLSIAGVAVARDMHARRSRADIDPAPVDPPRRRIVASNPVARTGS